MQLGSDVQIPDGLLAANALLREKPHQGVPSWNLALHQGIDERNSTAAIGIRASAQLNRIWPRYTGKERDAESGNDYMFARYYNSATGRFLSPDWSAKEDPVPYAHMDNPQSLNLYSYVQNNPLAKPDLDGHGCPPDCGDPTGPTVAPPTFADRFVDANVAVAKWVQHALQHPAVQAFLSVIPGLGPEEGALQETESGLVGGALPDSAPVVRGGLPENIPKGTGVTTDASGNLQGVSVNSGAGKTVEQLSKGLPQNKVGTTTVGEVRAAGGEVTPSPTANNPNHCTMCGITPQKATKILKVIPNPAKTPE